MLEVGTTSALANAVDPQSTNLSALVKQVVLLKVCATTVLAAAVYPQSTQLRTLVKPVVLVLKDHTEREVARVAPVEVAPGVIKRNVSALETQLRV